jgi:hypothetical protein
MTPLKTVLACPKCSARVEVFATVTGGRCINCLAVLEVIGYEDVKAT